jgi:hypothetical protein
VRVYYATQVQSSPPTIVLFVNNPSHVSETYQRFIINRFRELLPYAEVPIKLVMRGRQGREETDGAAPAKPATPRSRKPSRTQPAPRVAGKPGPKSKPRAARPARPRTRR